MNLYIHLFDVSVSTEDPRHNTFLCLHNNNDIASLVPDKAKENNSRIEDIRMFIYEKKRTWKQMQQQYAKGYNWKLLDGPVKRASENNA